MSYYKDYNYISNSMLGEFHDALRMHDKGDLTNVYNFGNLIDAMLTEEHKIVGNTLNEESSENAIEFSDYEMNKAKLMKFAADNDQTISLLNKTMEFQKVIKRDDFIINYNGYELVIPAKCKFDALGLKFKKAADYKSTAAKSSKQFIDSIYHFNYDRQAAWYMDLANVDQMIYIGISKSINKATKKHDIYKYVIKRGDETYLSGLKKYSFLAFHYYFMIHTLDTNKLILNIK